MKISGSGRDDALPAVRRTRIAEGEVGRNVDTYA